MSWYEIKYSFFICCISYCLYYLVLFSAFCKWNLSTVSQSNKLNEHEAHRAGFNTNGKRCAHLSEPSCRLTLAYSTSTAAGSSFMYSMPITSRGRGLPSVRSLVTREIAAEDTVSYYTPPSPSIAVHMSLQIAITCRCSALLLLDNMSKLLEVVACLVHLCFVQQHQSAQGQVELGRVLEDAVVHPAILGGISDKLFWILLRRASIPFSPITSRWRRFRWRIIFIL